MIEDKLEAAGEPYTDLQQAHRDNLLAKYPGRSKGVRAGQNAPCIEMFCIECMGEGTKAAIECDSRGCFLWGAVFKRASR